MFRNLLSELLPRVEAPRGDSRLFCAVSGGADSLALLVLMRELGRAVTAIHVDHGLRQGSEVEAAVVAEAASRFGALFESRTVFVEPGPNVEARARAARYAALPAGVLTGHTADDQAETVLLNMMRGAGLDGLAGMKAEGHPLLRIRRSETHALCIAAGLDPVVDPSNSDPAILRNRVRAELLPLMNDIATRDVAPVIARQSAHLRSAADTLERLAEEIDPTDARLLAKADPELAARAVRRWLRSSIDQEAHPPDAKAVARVLDVASGHSLACDVVSGLRVERTGQRLRLISTAVAAKKRPANEPSRSE